jgi:hypothetical protein
MILRLNMTCEKEKIKEHRVRETESIKQMAKERIDDFQKHQENQINKIKSYSEIKIREKLDSFKDKKINENTSNEMINIVHYVIDGLMDPESQKSEEIDTLLKENGKLNNSNRYIIKFSIITLLIIAFFSLLVKFYRPVMNAVSQKMSKREKEAQTLLIKKQNQRQIAQKFIPKKSELYHDTYTDRVLYSKNYMTIVQDKDFQNAWILSVNDFILDELLLNDHILVKILAIEESLHKELIRLSENININSQKQSIQRMRDQETQKISEIMALLKDETKFNKLLARKKNFYLQYYENKH